MPGTYTDNFTEIDCGGCGIRYYVPEFWLNDRRKTGNGWNCPNGCNRIFNKTEADKLRDQLTKEKHRTEQLEARVEREKKYRMQEERSHIATKGHLTRQKKRAKNGTCPYCTRTFKQLQKHIECKHPEKVE